MFIFDILFVPYFLLFHAFHGFDDQPAVQYFNLMWNVS